MIVYIMMMMTMKIKLNYYWIYQQIYFYIIYPKRGVIFILCIMIKMQHLNVYQHDIRFQRSKHLEIYENYPFHQSLNDAVCLNWKNCIFIMIHSESLSIR